MSMLKEFQELTENDWYENPIAPTRARLELRTHLITEEAREFEVAAGKGDYVAMADALVDILYVTFGSFGELGMPNIAAELFSEVHRSNMSKLCNTLQEAEETVKWYRDEVDKADRCIAKHRPIGEKFLVYRVSDNKTLKSKYYSKANLKTIIDRQVKQ